MSALSKLLTSTAKPAPSEENSAPRARPAQSLLVAEKPQFNPDLGLKLLKVVLQGNDIPTFQNIETRHLHEQEIALYEFSKAHLRQYGRLPEPDTARSSGHALDVVSNETADYFINRIAERETHVAIQENQKLLIKALAGKADQATLLAIVRKQLSDMLAVTRNQRTDTFSTLAQEVLVDFQLARRTVGLIGVPTGYESLDMATGGIMPGELTAYVGRPGVGKTILLSEAFLACHAAGLRCVVCSNEMPGKQLVRRWLGRKAGINHSLIKKGEVSTHGERRLYAVAEQIARGPDTDVISGSFNQTIPDLERSCANFGPDALFIDAAYLVKASGITNRQQQADMQEQVVREIKGLLLDRKLPGFVTYQLNRTEKNSSQGKKHRADLSSIAGTDAVGKDADIVAAMLYAPSPYQLSHRIIDPMKTRDGAAERFAVSMDFDTMDFSEFPIETIMGSDDNDSDEEVTDYMR